MPSLATTKTIAATPSKYCNGKAALNWCPQCAHKLVETQLKLKDGQTIYGQKCSYCHYIHEPQFG